MREFICTVKIRLRQGQPTKKALEHLGMELLGYSESQLPAAVGPTTQHINVAGQDMQEFGNF